MELSPTIRDSLLFLGYPVAANVFGFAVGTLIVKGGRKVACLFIRDHLETHHYPGKVEQARALARNFFYALNASFFLISIMIFPGIHAHPEELKSSFITASFFAAISAGAAAFFPSSSVIGNRGDFLEALKDSGK